MDTEPEQDAEVMRGVPRPVAVALAAASGCALLTWFAPTGESSLVLPALVFPWAVAAVVAARPDTLSMFFETSGPPRRAPIGLAAELVSFLVFANAFGRFDVDAPLTDIATPALLIGGALWACYLLVDRAARSTGPAVLFLLSSAAYGYGATLFANERFATAPVEVVQDRVLGSSRLAPSKAGRAPTFSLDLERHGHVQVRSEVWGSNTRPGGTVCVWRRVGALGFTSFEVDLCPKPARTPGATSR